MSIFDSLKSKYPQLEFNELVKCMGDGVERSNKKLLRKSQLLKLETA